VRAERGMRRGEAGRGRRWGVFLAMAALLLQLAATAFHFHAEDFGFLPGHSGETALHAGAGAPWPGKGQPGTPAHDDCALCFTLQLAGSAPLPDIAQPAAPGQVATLSPPPAPLRLAATPYLLFRTRAPPSL
jgi:hypothetical protein